VDNVYNAGAVAAGNYTFNNVIANHSISVKFSIDTFVISATAGNYGTILPNGNVTVTYYNCKFGCYGRRF
jgi:aspartate ammonia-lyase